MSAAAWAKGRLLDRPRDAKGRFVSMGGSAADAATDRARKVGTVEAHRQATQLHMQAAANHAGEAARLLERAKGLGKREAKVYAEAAAKHQELAKAHRTAALEHAADAPTLERFGIEHSLDPSGKAMVESAIARGGFGPYLAEHPLESVREHSMADRSCNGVYARPTALGGKAFISIKDSESAEVTFARVQKGGSRSLGHEGCFSVSQMAKTPAEMRERIMVHELGHHIHLDRSNPLPGELMVAIVKAHGQRVQVKDDKASTKPGKWTPSAYSNGDHKEWFAEVHAAYVFHPKELKAKDPEAYALVKRVRAARGMK